MYITIVALPLISSFISGILGRKIGITGAQIITCGLLILTTIITFIAFYEVALCNSPVSIILFS
jgi:NADH-ubiquinone oxidoreductase chain 5